MVSSSGPYSQSNWYKISVRSFVSLRWPLLAEYLSEHPEKVPSFRDGQSDPNVPEELQPLVSEKPVMDVFRGEGVDAALDEKVITSLLDLKGPDTVSAVVA